MAYNIGTLRAKEARAALRRARGYWLVHIIRITRNPIDTQLTRNTD